MENQRRNQKRNSVKAIPEGFHSVTPFLIANQASDLIKFIKEAFDGEITSIMKTDDGSNKIMHATVQIGDSQIMIADSMEKFPAASAKLYLYVEDVDSVYQQAIDANGTSIRELTDEFYGDRSAGIKDAWGNEWWIATHIEDVNNDEMERRKKKLTEGVTA